MKILLADDSMTAQNMGKKILTDAGFDVIAVSNGAAALKKITAENPDIIILDVFMPGYTGLEVCERLKNNPETSRKPVLLTVGKMEPFNPDDSNRVRAEGVMIKPFEATDLTAAVQAIAKRFNLSSAPAPQPPAPPKPAVPYKSYEETVRMSQEELHQQMGMTDQETPKMTPVATAAAATASAVAVAAVPGLEVEGTVAEPVSSAVAPLPEVVANPSESESHKPFSHASVAQQVVGTAAEPVPASEPAAWDPVLDGISISESVVTPVPATPEAQPAFGLDEYMPSSGAQVAQEEDAVSAEPVTANPATAAAEEEQVSSPSAYLTQASAAMELETSHPVVAEEPVVESTPGFEPNVAPPVVVETHAEQGIEAGIEQPAPEVTVTQDPALVGGVESFSGFTTRFGVEHPEEIPVGIVPELMPDSSSSYEYQPPEEGHVYETATEVPAATEMTPVAAPEPPPTSAFGTPHPGWEMVAVEPASISEPPASQTSAIPEASATPAEPTTPEAVHSGTEAAFDPDATQALPDEFFTAAEPELETTAELVGASVPEDFETVAPQRPVVESWQTPPEEASTTTEVVAPSIAETELPSAEAEPQGAVPPVSVPEPPAQVPSILTEPPVLSVGPEPPAIEEQPVEAASQTPASEDSSAAVAAAAASVLGGAITEQLTKPMDPSTNHNGEEVAPGDQTQVFIASAVQRVLDRMKPTLIEEIAREMSHRRKPRKDPDE
ncbi:MAG TPA: response regulator [Terriglobales bacterium]|nr:response regulator [Terriglobales bacterium]